MIDVSQTITPKSDQLNADDLIGGDRTILITEVKKGNGEQPIAIYFEGDNGKPYLPCKSMRRVMVKAWGKDGLSYVGKAMTIYNDPSVTWGGAKVGGIRISAMTDIDRGFSMALTMSQKQRKNYEVKQLVMKAPEPEFDQQELIKDAKNAASCGMETYKKWFTKRPENERNFIMGNETHEKCKIAAGEFDNAQIDDENGGE